jgi:hypothetical protein
MPYGVRRRKYHVEKEEVALGLANRTYFSPLIWSRVYSSRVVCACMEKNDASRGHLLDVLNHSSEIETFSILLKVPVVSDFQSTVLEDRVVISPSRRRNKDLFSTWEETSEELSTDSQGACSRERLTGDNPSLLFV